MEHEILKRQLEETLKKIERVLSSFSKTTTDMQKEHEDWLNAKKIRKISDQLAGHV